MDAHELAVPAVMAKNQTAFDESDAVCGDLSARSPFVHGPGSGGREAATANQPERVPLPLRACFAKLTAPLQVFNDQENHQ